MEPRVKPTKGSTGNDLRHAEMILFKSRTI